MRFFQRPGCCFVVTMLCSCVVVVATLSFELVECQSRERLTCDPNVSDEQTAQMVSRGVLMLFKEQCAAGGKGQACSCSGT
jgi:hypothetical protein